MLAFLFFTKKVVNSVQIFLVNRQEIKRGVMKKTSCLGEFMRYTSLNVLGMVGLSCYILADTFFIAKGLGSDGLAALNMPFPLIALCMAAE